MISRQLGAEFIGTLILLATVVGSGIMAETLADGNIALALLCNALPTGGILYVLIMGLGPLSGAHFNPAVTLIFVLRGEIGVRPAILYVVVQIAGAVLGVWLAHVMFDQSVIQISQKMRAGPAQFAAEMVATFGLVFTILTVLRANAAAIPAAVGLYIMAAYWFTASTSFANPAVTIGRTLTDTFAGIYPANAPAFIVAQIIGAVLAYLVCRWLLKPSGEPRA
ncbi:MAG: aquaporin family protein [Rhodobiaceae bacterium]|nr:aquaporin family protein [Rhodobiaceae bacterium]